MTFTTNHSTVAKLEAMTVRAVSQTSIASRLLLAFGMLLPVLALAIG